MYKKLMKFLEKSEGNSIVNRTPHFIFSAQNPKYPDQQKLQMNHDEAIEYLRKQGYDAQEMDGMYGEPEKSIIIHNVPEEAVSHLHNLGKDLGQESGIYSDGYNHEMHFYHGDNAGKHVKGQGTEIHKRPPQDFYSIMNDGTIFTHNFDFDKFHLNKEVNKFEIDFVKSAAENMEEHSEPSAPNVLTHRGVPVDPNPKIKNNTKSILDTDTGTLHTPKGSFKLHMPDTKDQDYQNILNSPDIQSIHTNAMDNWFKLHNLHQTGQKLPEDIIAHANIFSILSANNPVPQQELAYSRLVDTMKQLNLDPTHPDFAQAMARGGQGRETWKGKDRPQDFPKHAEEYWRGKANPAITQLSASKTTGRQPGDIVAIGSMNSFADRLAKYPQTHKYISDLVHAFGSDSSAIVSQMMADKSNPKLPKDHPMKQGVGLGSKTSRYAASMMGGGNSVIPDTHFVRHIFGLDANTDSSTIAYLKNTLWNPKNHDLLNNLDDYYNAYHPAVQYVQNKYFGGEQNKNATFPAFWLHWLSISPHEKQMSIGKPYASKNLTDHTPYWDTAQEVLDKYGLSNIKKSENMEDVALPIRTAAAALELEHKLGSAPASMIFYSHILPHLMQKKVRPFDIAKSENDLMKAPVVADYAGEVSTSSDLHHRVIRGSKYLKSTKIDGHIIHSADEGGDSFYHYITDNGKPDGKIVSYVNVTSTKDHDSGEWYPAITNSVTEPKYRRQGMSSALTRHAANFHDGIYSDEVVSPEENKKWQKIGAKIAPFNPEPVEEDDEAWKVREEFGDPGDSPDFRHYLSPTKKSEEDQYLEHYSDKEDLKTIDPAFTGSGVDTSQRAAANRQSKLSFYYPQGYKNTEPIVTNRAKSKYTVKIPEGAKIFDSQVHGSDLIDQSRLPSGHLDIDTFVNNLKQAGFHGFKSRPQGIDMIAMFHELPVHSEEKIKPFEFNKNEVDLIKTATPFIPKNTESNHHEGIRQVAMDYAKSKGIANYSHPTAKQTVNKERAARIADAYHNMKHDPDHPDVKNAYNALIDETMDQWNHIKKTGLKISKIKPGMENPYKTSKDLFKDVRENNHMWYFPTEQGFGSKEDQINHPMLKPTTEKHEGKAMPANDIFRIVHDYFGHAKEGYAFGPTGEENAWHEHSKMFSPLAQKALTTETRGQNSWVNFGPHGEHNRKNPAQTIYADQKAGLLPEHVYETDEHPANFNKSEQDLQKGALRRIAPFEPAKDVDQDEADAVSNWQDLEGSREEIPEMHPHAKMRALNKLAARTSVKRAPDGKRLFLLHRGMEPSEMQDTLKGRGNKKYIHSENMSSWTPSLGMARGFGQENYGGGHLSAWIHEDNIHHVPNAYGDPMYGKNKFHDEHEIIVKPHKSAAAQSQEIFEEDSPKNVDQVINTRGKMGGTRLGRERADKNYRNRLRYMRGMGKTEDLEKNMKGIRAGIISAVAAGTLATAQPAEAKKPMHQRVKVTTPNVIINHDQQPKQENNKNHIMTAIQMVESSGGKNTNHEKLPVNSIHRGERAFGSYGLTPLLIRETIGMHKDLSRKYGHMKKLTHNDFHEAMNKHPELEQIIASRHYDRLAKKLGHDPAKIGYAWLNGISGTLKALKQGKNINNHWHVKKILNAYKSSKNAQSVATND